MSRALLITEREISEVLRDINLIGPMLMLPLLMAFVAGLAVFGTSGMHTETVGILVGSVAAEQLTTRAADQFLGLSPDAQQQIVQKMIKAVMLPMFWIVTVGLTATVSADSFVGEKERATLEPLLATPIRIGELLFGKLLSAVGLSVLGTWVGVALFSVAVWRSTNPYLPRFLLGDPDWLIAIVLMVPLLATMSASIAAIISTRASTTRAAYQLNGLVVLPMVALLIPQTMLLYFLTPHALAILVCGLIALDALLIQAATRTFDRERLIGGGQ
jgi:ABC-2 type transport system permease protein